jgi:hypothetical protein
MLEKIAGVCLVEKLQAIQLYEADFKCYNQLVFGKAAMDLLNSIGYAPKKLFSQKGSTRKDAKFDKTLLADLSRKQDIQWQWYQPMQHNVTITSTTLSCHLCGWY